MIDKFCTGCGEPNSSGARFCLKCGHSLSTDSPLGTLTEAESGQPEEGPRRRGVLPLALIAVVLVAGVTLWFGTSRNSSKPDPAVVGVVLPSIAPTPEEGSSMSPDGPTETANSDSPSTGTYTGYMGGSVDPRSQYQYRLRLNEQPDGSISGRIWQREGADQGVELLRGSRIDQTVLVRGIGWKWASVDAWRESRDAFELRFVNGERQTIIGRYRCMTCRSSDTWYTMNPVERIG